MIKSQQGSIVILTALAIAIFAGFINLYMIPHFMRQITESTAREKRAVVRQEVVETMAQELRIAFDLARPPMNCPSPPCPPPPIPGTRAPVAIGPYQFYFPTDLTLGAPAICVDDPLNPGIAAWQYCLRGDQVTVANLNKKSSRYSEIASLLLDSVLSQAQAQANGVDRMYFPNLPTAGLPTVNLSALSLTPPLQTVAKNFRVNCATNTKCFLTLICRRNQMLLGQCNPNHPETIFQGFGFFSVN